MTDCPCVLWFDMNGLGKSPNTNFMKPCERPYYSGYHCNINISLKTYITMYYAYFFRVGVLPELYYMYGAIVFIRLDNTSTTYARHSNVFLLGRQLKTLYISSV